MKRWIVIAIAVFAVVIAVALPALAASGVFVTKLSTTACANPDGGSGSCDAASSGFVAMQAASSTVTVATTLVKAGVIAAGSQIFVQEDSTLGTALGVTCNVSATDASTGTYRITTRTNIVSFVITRFVAGVAAAPTTNPLCLSWHLVN